MVSLLVFALGLVIGSFLNALIYRLEKGESVLKGRSYCPRCKHSLAWYDLIPLLSFLLLGGKCRYCKGSISLQYPLVECITGLVFVVLFLHAVPIENLVRLSLPQVAEFIYLWAVASAFIVIFVYDVKHYLIPDKVLYPAVGLVLFYQILAGVGNVETLFGAVVSALSASAFFLAIYLVSKGKWMGFGDVKLAFFIGVFLGWPDIVVALFSAFTLGAVVGLLLIAFKKKGLKSEVPFAPFLIIGTAIAFFFGSFILPWYLGLFLV